jgi:glycerate 2-kinase
MAGHVVCAPDKFRDALTARDAAAALADGARQAGWTATPHPIADGGEGSREALAASRGGTTRDVPAQDPRGRPVRAPYLLTEDGTAVVVAADVIGLEPLAAADRDPMRGTSRGLAAPLRAAVADGARRIVVFVGGVATVDGGLGLLAALGAAPADRAGRELHGTGADLESVERLDLEPARAALGGVELVVATDVSSPLFGPAGAARVYGPQKGAAPGAVKRLDAGLRRLAPLLGPAAAQPGAGAAGGLGAAFMALGAQRASGAELVLELTGFAARLAGADLCITAEGKVDGSTAAGKAVAAVLAACVDADVPCVILGGMITDDALALYERGAAGILAIGSRPRSHKAALAATSADLRRAARAVCTLAGQARPAG